MKTQTGRIQAGTVLARGLLAALLLAGAQAASAAPLTVVNAGFEDTSGQTVFNEFTFGTPAGWTSYDPNGFPGYRIDLFSVDQFNVETILAQDLDSLIIPEAEVALSTITVDIGAGHTAIGDMLGIRLVNLNETRGVAGPPDLEVDFDDVRLTATAISAPGAVTLGLLGLAALGVARATGRKRRDTVAIA